MWFQTFDREMTKAGSKKTASKTLTRKDFKSINIAKVEIKRARMASQNLGIESNRRNNRISFNTQNKGKFQRCFLKHDRLKNEKYLFYSIIWLCTLSYRASWEFFTPLILCLCMSFNNLYYWSVFDSRQKIKNFSNVFHLTFLSTKDKLGFS